MKKMTVTFVLSTGLSLSARAQIESEIPVVYPLRTSFSLRVQKPLNPDFNKNLVYPRLQSLLNSYGATFDQQSEIKIHEENSFIDFSCFNCVIRNHHYENINSKPDNGHGTGGIFDL